MRLHPLYAAALEAQAMNWEPDWFWLKRRRDGFTVAMELIGGVDYL